MATKKHGLKMAITSAEEIMSLMDFLNDLVQLKGDLSDKKLDDIDFSEYRILGKSFFFSKDDYEDLLISVCTMADQIHFQRILWNADIMLKSCADLSLDHLDFNPEIKKGLELLKQQNSTSNTTEQ